MPYRVRAFALSVAFSALLSAAPADDPIDLVRRGNAAFARADYPAAAELFEQAEEWITDPGLAAFNKATALYRLGRYREAELHYRRCLEGAAGPRRARALYDLGNCLLRESQGTRARLLDQAIAFYEKCLADDAADADMLADARHNLEIARALRAAAKPDPAHDEGNTSDPGRDSPPPEERPGNRAGGNDPGVVRGKPAGLAKGDEDAQHRAQDPSASGQSLPGEGTLPTLPDRDAVTPLSPEDTRAYLSQITDRILRERREHLQRPTPAAARNIMDW
jgi:tetratricopeptide (TPR) repeat protein